jgi:hypothetical protein
MEGPRLTGDWLMRGWLALSPSPSALGEGRVDVVRGRGLGRGSARCLVQVQVVSCRVVSGRVVCSSGA